MDWNNVDAYMSIGESTVYIGDDPSWMAAGMTPVTEPFYSTGFHLTTSNAEGRYLRLRRTAHPEYIDTAIMMGKFLVYQS